jgi:hypothetical protein
LLILFPIIFLPTFVDHVITDLIIVEVCLIMHNLMFIEQSLSKNEQVNHRCARTYYVRERHGHAISPKRVWLSERVCGGAFHSYVVRASSTTR